MKEADDRSKQPASFAHAEEHAWDVAALTDALKTPPEPTRDLLFGEGLAFRLGPERTVRLALYPADHAVELSTPDAVVAFRRPSAAKPLDEHVLFRASDPHQDTTLVVGRDGTVSLLVQPLDPSQPPLTLPDPAPAAEGAFDP